MKRICSHCQKENATVHYQETVNGQVRQMDLCPACAAKMGLGPSSFFGQGLSLDLPLFASPKKGSEEALSCPVCKMTLSAIRRSGRFGCSACYDSFSSRLDLTPYVGKGYETEKKESSAEEKKDEVSLLREKLQAALAEENYEEAALLRDEIRAKEGK